MKICVIGTGYVGLVAGTCLSEMGHNVICVDNDAEKLNKLKNGIVPIYEPGLEDLINHNVSEKRLTFTENLDFAVKTSDVCYIAVGTPPSDDGSVNLSAFFEVVKSIAKSINGYKIIVDKSTVPIGTAEKVTELVKQYTDFDFDVVSNPEFLKQGAAVEDFLKPDRIIIGSDSQKATVIMKEVYSSFLRTGNPILEMDVKSAEMTKYAANSFLAVKISYINEIANICEKVGADIDMVRKGLCSDSRIGSKFLFPGLGYGGSCFPKDVKALINTAVNIGLECEILKSADKINYAQRQNFVNKITNEFGENLSGKTFAVWGLSFKPQTNDMREAPSITIINELLKKGASVQAFDPKAIEVARGIFNNKITYSENAIAALNNADCLLLLTEWNEFRNPDFDVIKSKLKNPVIIDGRNQYDKQSLYQKGFKYICIGK